MDKDKHIGAQWGTDGIFFVEQSDKAILRLFQAEFNDESHGSIEDGPLSPVGMSIISQIQEAFRIQAFIPPEIYLSIPTREIIFRTFVIPWMPNNEIKDVVEFEATKYIPFALDQLNYTYHPETLNDKATKKIRISFAAIKKDILSNYTSIFEQAGVPVVGTEPEVISLIRALVSNNAIPKDQIIVIIEKRKRMGKIVVVDKCVPQFVREFSYGDDQADEESQVSNFLNEVRISLSYFMRQERNVDITQTYLLSEDKNEGLAQKIQDDIQIPVNPVTTEGFLKNVGDFSIDYLYSFGNSICDQVKLDAEFNFSKKKTKTLKLKASSMPVNFNYKSVSLVAGICLPIIALCFFLSRGITGAPQKKANDLKAKLGSYESAATKKLMSQKEEVYTNIKELKQVRTNSEVNNLMTIIPNLLPEGTWIKDLSIKYDGSKSDAKPAVSFNGYAYLENTKEQFRLVHKLLTNFQRDKTFSDYFENIDLKSIRVEKLNDFVVTYFELVCK